MKRLKNFLLAALVSPEVVVALAIFAFVSYAPEQAAILGNAIRSDAEVWKYLPAITLLFAGAAINSSFKLRAPLESFSNKPLYEWPLYPLLVDRVYVGLAYGIASAIASLFLWFLGGRISPSQIATVFLLATAVSGVTALTMLLAQQSLRELLEKYS